ncbi:MAG: acyl-CoA dehydrogenase family protein [Pseudomonadales bacterium]|jgi:alkylation response protein AidB-like acyl-CoA dehydrogenase|nr:acyl-CoA dehydrogenase family protein [Pseudomonadales bacterium]|tara:strand:- start:4047 stop:5186 length:1140 start_codon:yes stop_codon:yes gene_type:complete
MGATEDFRAWVEGACPEEIRGRRLSYMGGSKNPMPGPAFQRWFEACVERGFTVPEWPEEYGGAGLDQRSARSLAEAMRTVGAPLPLFSTGTTMLGSTLLEYGTEDQKQRHLSRIARGEVAWCQGYSEPGSGSDLASLRTRAEDHRDCYLVNGSKIWTSLAHLSDWIFCLVRTDPGAPKQQGISFLLFALDTPGVTVRNFDLIHGESDFCEAFFDNVRVPKADLVGRENDGWTIAKRLLQYERSSVAKGQFLPRGGALAAVLKHYGNDDPTARENALRIDMDDAAFQLTKTRAAEETKGGVGTFATSTFKLLSSEIESRRLDAIIAMMGSRGLGWSGEGFDDAELESTRKWLYSKGFLIAGGSSEIQRNVVAKRVLGLPD